MDSTGQMNISVSKSYLSSKTYLFGALLNIYDVMLMYIWLRLHGAIYRPVPFVLMLRYCANSVKAIRYESTSLNRIVAYKSHRVGTAQKINFLMPLLTYTGFDSG